jgi:hypothetical protein
MVQLMADNPIPCDMSRSRIPHLDVLFATSQFASIGEDSDNRVSTFAADMVDEAT